MARVDPIHFFTERGVSALTFDHLSSRIDELEEEVEELKRRNRTLTLRLQAIAESEPDEASCIYGNS